MYLYEIIQSTIQPLTQVSSERLACIKNAIHYSMRLSIQLISALHQLIIAVIKFLNSPKDKVENHTAARRLNELQQTKKATSYWRTWAKSICCETLVKKLKKKVEEQKQKCECEQVEVEVKRNLQGRRLPPTEWQNNEKITKNYITIAHNQNSCGCISMYDTCGCEYVSVKEEKLRKTKFISHLTNRTENVKNYNNNNGENRIIPAGKHHATITKKWKHIT